MKKERTENQINHLQNLAKLDGFFYKGRYYRDGIVCVPKVKDLQLKGRERINAGRKIFGR